MAYAEGITPTRVTGETVRATLVRLGLRWRRAKTWITSPDPAYPPQKARRDRLIALAGTRADWAVGFEDECWWSRVARPALHAWSDAGPPRLVEQTVAADDPDPKAVACYGLLLRRQTVPQETWLRFVDGRPVSAVTQPFLEWCCQRLVATGVTTLVLVWDNAAWHVSGAGRRWRRQHNQQAHRTGGVRIVPCFLPTKSPWLNPIEPQWVHAKRRVVAPARLLTARDLEERVCAAFTQPVSKHLAIPQKVV